MGAFLRTIGILIILFEISFIEDELQNLKTEVRQVPGTMISGLLQAFRE